MPKRKWSGWSLSVQVSVPDDGTQAETRQERAKRLHQHHRAVAAAGTADRHREVGLPFTFVERQQELEQAFETREQLPALRERHHELLHRRVAAVQGAQALHEMRVREEADVEDQV